MKKIKKNQVIIAVMTVALGVAGYINFSGNSLDLANADEKKQATQVVSAGNEVVGVSADQAMNDGVMNEHIMLEEDKYIPGQVYSEAEIGEDISQISDGDFELNSDTQDIGEAVLTSSQVASNGMITAKMNREQVRSKSLEAYKEIIDSEVADGISVEDATAAYLKLTEDMAKEADAETVLAASGYPNAVVSIGDNSVDVIVENASLDGMQRAQIEEVVVRKTGCSVEQIVISCVK